MSPPKLTKFEWQLALDLKGALEFIMRRHKREADAELWLTILQLDVAMDEELRRSTVNIEALKKAQQLKADSLRQLGLPANTDTRKRRSE